MTPQEGAKVIFDWFEQWKSLGDNIAKIEIANIIENCTGVGAKPFISGSDKEVDYICSDCRAPLKTLSAYYEHTCPVLPVDE